MHLSQYDFTSRYFPILLLFCLAGPLCSAADRDAAADAEPIGQLIDQSSVTGGLIVHLGCNQGVHTAALRTGEQFLVHGLDTDWEDVTAAREHLKSLGVYGNVSVDRWDGKHLPYVDNSVNAIVAEEPCDLSRDELLRVLCPRGVAYVRQGFDVQTAGTQRTGGGPSGAPATCNCLRHTERRWMDRDQEALAG